MDRVYGYVRASTIDQQGTLEIQEEQIRREYEYRWKPKGYEFAGLFMDSGVSASKYTLRQRPQGLRMTNMTEHGDTVIFTKMDRAFRNVEDTLAMAKWFELRGVHMVLLDCQADTSTASGRLMMTMLGAIAEFESNRRSERMYEHFANRRAKGKVTAGGVPYGFKFSGPRKGRYLIRDDHTRTVGGWIVDWRDGVNGERGWSFDVIYVHLIRERIKTRKNKEWSLGAIKRAYQGEHRLRAIERKQGKGLTGETGDGKVTPTEGEKGKT
jgi:DNA invertase Pin-like site-specific DNA recombinase